MSTERERIEWIDSLRGLMMLCGVMVHFLLMLPGQGAYEGFRYLCGFVLPVHMAISGYLLRPSEDIRGWKRYMLKNAVRYLVPYVIFCAVSLIIYMAVEALHGSLYPGNVAVRIIGAFRARGSWIYIPYCSPAFYFVLQFMGLGIFELIMLIKNKGLQWLAVACCMAASYTLCLLDAPKLIWNLDSALMMSFFLMLGREFSLRRGKEPKKPLLTGLILILAGGVFIYTNRYFGVQEMSFNNSRYGSIVHMMLGGGLTAAGLFIIFSRYADKFIRPVRALLGFFGRNTMAVTAWDPLIRDICISLFASLGIAWLLPLRYILQLALLALIAFFWGRVWNGRRDKLFARISLDRQK